jgi:peptidoglycan-associated lipoprotein
VRDYLITRGISAERLRTISYGKERPLAICSEESCYRQNRRAVTVLEAGTGA